MALARRTASTGGHVPNLVVADDKGRFLMLFGIVIIRCDLPSNILFMIIFIGERIQISTSRGEDTGMEKP